MENNDQNNENEIYKKLNCLRKLGELAQSGCELPKNYSMGDSLEELETACENFINKSGEKITHLHMWYPEYMNDNSNPFDIKFENTWLNKVPYESDNGSKSDDEHDFVTDKTAHISSTQTHIHNNLDDSEISDGEIGDTFDNEKYTKLNCLRKLGELAKLGYKFTEIYSMNNSMEDLNFACKLHYEAYKQNLTKNELAETREYFLKFQDPQYYLDNLWTTGMCSIKLFNMDTLQYVVKYDQELWKILTKLFLYFLRSEFVQKLLNGGFEWLEHNVSSSHQYINSFKCVILTSDENTFIKLKKSTMEQNYKFIQMVKDDDEIEHENRQEIIKLLLHINSIVAEIKETTDDLIQQIEEIFSSNDKIIKFAEQIKNFVLANLECTIKNDVFYCKHIIPRVEQNILSNCGNN